MKSPNLDIRIWMPNRTFKYLFVYKRAHFLSLEINQLHDSSLFKNMMKKPPCSEINAFKNSDPGTHNASMGASFTYVLFTLSFLYPLTCWAWWCMMGASVIDEQNPLGLTLLISENRKIKKTSPVFNCQEIKWAVSERSEKETEN